VALAAIVIMLVAGISTATGLFVGVVITRHHDQHTAVHRPGRYGPYAPPGPGGPRAHRNGGPHRPSPAPSATPS
jgi:hypothetical protein